MDFPVLIEASSLSPMFASSESFGDGARVVSLRGEWNYFGSYTSEEVYAADLELLVQGALLALGFRSGSKLIATMNPYEGQWIDWLLPMWGWSISKPIDDEWNAGVWMYAQHFAKGYLHSDYTGCCFLALPIEGLRLCADNVMRNYAPYSWVIFNPESGVAVYFHNSMSFGLSAVSSEQLETAVGCLHVNPLLSVSMRHD